MPDTRRFLLNSKDNMRPGNNTDADKERIVIGIYDFDFERSSSHTTKPALRAGFA